MHSLPGGACSFCCLPDSPQYLWCPTVLQMARVWHGCPRISHRQSCRSTYWTYQNKTLYAVTYHDIVDKFFTSISVPSSKTHACQWAFFESHCKNDYSRWTSWTSHLGTYLPTTIKSICYAFAILLLIGKASGAYLLRLVHLHHASVYLPLSLEDSESVHPFSFERSVAARLDPTWFFDWFLIAMSCVNCTEFSRSSCLHHCM